MGHRESSFSATQPKSTPPQPDQPHANASAAQRLRSSSLHVGNQFERFVPTPRGVEEGPLAQAVHGEIDGMLRFVLATHPLRCSHQRPFSTVVVVATHVHEGSATLSKMFRAGELPCGDTSFVSGFDECEGAFGSVHLLETDGSNQCRFAVAHKVALLPSRFTESPDRQPHRTPRMAKTFVDPVERLRLRRGFLWAGWKPAPSGELWWAVRRCGAVALCAMPTSQERRHPTRLSGVFSLLEIGNQVR